MGLHVSKAFTGLLFLAVSAAAVSFDSFSGLTVTVTPDGAYDIQVSNPNWRLGGNLGPVTNLTAAAGVGPLGAYNEISFDFFAGASWHGSIRAYSGKRAVVFSMTAPNGAPNAAVFPRLSRFPSGLNHVDYSGMFAHPNFFAYSEDSPWIFFDGSANTFILSPASNFMVASSTFGPAGEISTGISRKIAAVPPGFTHQSLLVIDNGVNATFDRWGRALTTLTGKTRPASDSDVSLARLGYWTDAGSTYYYATEPGLSYPDTLRAIKSDFDRAGIALGYLQLDSWFYPKGASADWSDRGDGIYEYFAAMPVFHCTLAAFQQSIGVPLITHARWLDPRSPYRQMYGISGDVSTDPLYWNDIARFLSTSGVAVYEQDWLSERAQTAFNLTDPDAFLGNMSSGLGAQNLTVQYCMATTRHFLQSAKYSNVTTMRVSEDRFDRTRWDSFLYTSRLTSALGAWPFTDVFLSTETPNLVLATLSAGPVGIGDGIGKMDAEALRRAVRADGVIVKPDAPLVPADVSYLATAQTAQTPMLATTYSDFGGLRAWYLFSYPEGANTQSVFRPKDLGITGSVYLYNYFTGTGSVVSPSKPITQDTGDWLYQVAAPIGPSGMAVIGDTGQFVTLGKKRIPSLVDDGDGVSFTVAFAPGEARRIIEGYSPDQPAAVAQQGGVESVDYDPSTHRFRVAVLPGDGGSAEVRLVRESTFPIRRHR